MAAPAVISRLLVLAPFPPRRDASHGGSRVIAELLPRLARHRRLGLLHLAAAGEPECDPALHTCCEFVRAIPRPCRATLGPIRWNARLLRSLAGGRPMWAGDWRVPAFGAALRDTLARWRPDLIQAEFHVMAQYLLEVAAPRSVLVQHEPGVPAAAERSRRSNGIRRPIYRADHYAWRRYERAVLDRMSGVVVFTARDRAETLRLAPRVHAVRIPLAANVADRPLHLPTSPPSIVFVGNFAHPPNAEAAAALIERIFPPVRRAIPAAELVLVGDGASSALRRAAARCPGVRFTGLVESVEPWLARAAVVVAPLCSGGGMRIKVLEALASGTPLVATPLAVEGIAVEHGKHVLVADAGESFSAAILHLLSDSARREALARDAWTWASRNLSWDAVACAYEQFYESLDT